MSLLGGGLVSPEMNKFEFVSNDHRHMSLVEGVGPEGWACPGGGDLGCGYVHGGWGPKPRNLSHDVCDIPTPTPVDRMTRENITFPQLNYT